ncbi:uncharacterized protein LOC123547531 [Mercenaria mercenaria]|uniref:uncharacterized protein LOC123547531 n=1 Tax=Mercenaria mercenaria TaxID=6596 RepID=UPI00234F33FE|nr:uncharacterized protein LOC123547531 [Mercenaria mercenaria]
MACCGDCSCDFPACMNNKTCCPDILFNHINILNITSTIEEVPRRVTGQVIQKDCIALYLSKYFISSKSSVFAYATCPSDTEAELVRNCTRSYNVFDLISLSDLIPVRSTWSGDLYRNRYCALCHGERVGQLETLDLKLQCSESTVLSTDRDILHAVYVHGICDIGFLSEYNFDACETARSGCNITGTFEDIMCSMYRSVIKIGDVPYQNAFCAICNQIFPDDLTCAFNRIHDGVNDFSFSGLLKLDNRDVLGNDIEGTNKCSANQLYDYIMDSCKDMTCSAISVLQHGICVDVFEQLQKITYTTFLRLTPASHLPITDAFAVADHVISNVGGILDGSTLCSVQMLYKTDMVFNESDLSGVENSSLLYFDTRFQFQVENYHDPSYIVEKIINLHNSMQKVWMKTKNQSVIFKIQIRDVNPRTFDMIDFLSRSEEINDAFYLSSEDAEELNITYLIQNHIAFENDNLAIFPHLWSYDAVGFCDIRGKDFKIFRLTTCPKVNISKLDLPWKKDTDGVSMLKGDFVIDSSEYGFVDEDHIIVCADKYKQYMVHVLQLKQKEQISMESIISIICSLLSILALCFTFFVFCFFPKLRETIPGKNNMSLIFTLLLAQSLYLVGSFSGLRRKSTECVVLGILIHFSWLVALFWMNICTFHMFRVLARTKVISHSSGIRKMIIYHLYAQLMAAMFVSINIGLSYTKSGDLGYGRVTCYISSQEMIIYTFGIPAGLIVLSNVCMFIFVVIKIKRSPSVQKSVQNERNDIIVFVKLSTITGATWVFGLLYIWTNLTTMSYIFIVLNASQGVFIMFAFVINKRVFDLFKNKLWGLDFTSSEGGNLTSKSTMYTTKP